MINKRKKHVGKMVSAMTILNLDYSSNRDPHTDDVMVPRVPEIETAGTVD
jgi:hypothetical protein